MKWPKRLSFCQHTADDTPFDELVEACVKAGVPRLGLQRARVEDFGIARAAQLVRDAGLEITSYGQIGYWGSMAEPSDRARALEDNIRYLDQAASLGAQVVGVSTGGVPLGKGDVRATRARLADRLRELLPHAVDRKLKLAMEPVNPMFFPQLSILSTIGQTLDVAEGVGHDSIGVLVDVSNTWWDPELLAQLRRASERIFLVQLNNLFVMQTKDWSVAPGTKFDRGLLDEAGVDFGEFLEGLDRYAGHFEVEVFNDELRSMNIMERFARVAASYEAAIGKHVHDS
jgi:sugar phosphate isomerase/epimerase